MSTTTLSTSGAPATNPTSDALTGWEPSAKDRCDRCGAQAYMLFSKGNTKLFLCGHHGNAHYKAAAEQQFDVLDFRSLLK